MRILFTWSKYLRRAKHHIVQSLAHPARALLPLSIIPEICIACSTALQWSAPSLHFIS